MEKNGENYLMRCIITCTVRLILIGSVNEVEFRFAGHIAGLREMRNAYRNLVTKP